jgi:hypothetical protein
MATNYGIAAVSQTVLGLLTDACPRADFPNARFELYEMSNFQNPMAEGISLFLYRVALNISRRNMPPRLGPDGRRYRAPLALDLYYLLTAWSPSAVQQQWLLSWAMRTLDDTPILPAGLLNHYAARADTFRPDETVDFICDPLSLPDSYSVWDIFKPNVPLVVNYIARLVAIESPVELPEAEPVQTREFTFTKAGR